MIPAPFRGLRGKLYALAVANAAAMVLLAAIAWLAYGHIERLSATLADREMAHIIDNARIGRLMSESLAQVDSGTRDCRSPAPREPGPLAARLAALADSTGDKQLAQGIAALAASTQRLQAECRTVGEVWATTEARDRQLIAELGRLETLISRALIEQTLAGKSTDHLDQIMALTVGYRESVMLIGKALAREGAGPPDPLVVGQIDDLHLRLQTMTAATPEMAALARHMRDSVIRYRSEVHALRGAEAAFATLQQENRLHRDRVLAQMHAHDEATGQQADRFRDELTGITAQTARQIAWIGGAIALLSLLLVAGFVRRGIQRPLSAVLHRIAAIRGGTAGPAPEEHLDGEWGTIQSALDDMARELAKANGLLKLVIDTAPVRIFWKDRDSRYLGCNQVFARDAGKQSSDELTGRDDFAMGWAEQAELYRADDRQVMDSGQARLNFEEPQTTPGGRTIWLSTSKVPLRDAAGTVIGVLGIYDDITARKDAQDALRQRDRYQRALLDNFPFAVWLKDTESRFLAVNGPFVELFGTPSADGLVGKNDFDIAPPDLAEGYRADDRAVLASGRSKNVEEEIIRADGKRTWFETYKSPVVLNGKVLGTVGFTRDITERKQAEERLRLQALVLDQIQDHVTVTDLDGKVTYVNQAELQYLKCGKEDILNRPVSAYGDDPRADATQDQIVAETLEKGAWHGEVVNFAADGAPIFLALRTSLIRDEAGRPIALVGTGTDITERKRSERRLSLALDASKILTWEMDFTTGKLGYDGSAMAGLGLDAANAPDTIEGWLARTHPDDRDRFMSALQQALLPGAMRGFDFEYRFGDNAGGYHWLQTVGNILQRDTEGQPLLAAGYSVNIDERKAIEAELLSHRDHLEQEVLRRTADLVEAKIAAEAASRAKSTFLANMSHELRTPMNGVMGMMALARRRMSDPEGLDKLDKAQGAAERLLGVLNDILDISKIEADRMVLEASPIQIGAVLENVGSLLGARAREKGLTWNLAIDNGLAREPLLGDALRLGQVLINLAGNAIKFTQRGHVTIRVAAGEGDDESLTVRFEVGDSGIGIEADALGRLFAAFEQADNSMTRKYGGTGLGLAISKRLVQMMGGEIGVESTPGAGSTFWFTARLKRRPAAADPVAVPPAPTSGDQLRRACAGAAILLAEDEPINREVSRYMLEDAGLQVETAEDGEEALRLSRTRRYALILMDMQMPKLNGVEATQAIRADAGNPNRATPVVALTANAYEDDRRTCLAAGMTGFVAKPVTADVLYETLLRALEEKAGGG